MKDEFGRKFGKKEFLETFIVVLITLFVVGVAFWIPALFSLILLVLAVTLIAVLADSRQKKK